MKLYASGEDYLEAILIIKKKTGMVRAIDLARHTGYSKASISHALGVLKAGGYIIVNRNGYISMTELGLETAERIFERHCFFKELLISVGVDLQTADVDACRMEHAISEASFQKIKKALTKSLMIEKDEKISKNKKHVDN